MADTPRSVEHARAAAEAVRSLNHETLPPTGYEWPADVDTVIGALEMLAERLPQALRQAERWLNDQSDAGLVGDDRWNARPRVTVEAASAHLCTAIVEAGRLAAALGEARAQTAHLTGIEAVR